jgi:nuclear transport factor 2 (NTF2) superfamily protein
VTGSGGAAAETSLWEFDEHGLMRRREASINDLRIDESERRIFGPRSAREHGAELPVR